MRIPVLPSSTGEREGRSRPSGPTSPVAACFLTMPFAASAKNARFVGHGIRRGPGSRGSLRAGPVA